MEEVAGRLTMPATRQMHMDILPNGRSLWGAKGMLVTDLAMRDMTERSDATLNRLWRALSRPFRTADLPTVSIVALSSVSATIEEAPIRALPKDEPEKWRRRDELQSEPSLGMFQRHARASAVRGILLARSGRVSEARSAFHAAISADPTTDLSAIPGFWELSRRGMFSAIEAYEDHERYRDAAALEASIRRTFQPRIVRSEAPTPTRSRMASGR